MNYVENVFVFCFMALTFIAVISYSFFVYKHKPSSNNSVTDGVAEELKKSNAWVNAWVRPLLPEINYIDELNKGIGDLKVALGDPLPNASVPVTSVSLIMDVKIKKMHKDAVIPKYAKAGDAGLDLTAVTKEFEVNEAGQKLLVYDTGLAFELPAGHVGLLFPRSSIAKTGLILSNAVGVLDENYRGTVKAKFRIDGRPTKKSSYNVGDRIMQLIIVPYPSINFVESEELSSSERGTGGFGSSGK